MLSLGRRRSKGRKGEQESSWEEGMLCDASGGGGRLPSEEEAALLLADAYMETGGYNSTSTHSTWREGDASQRGGINIAYMETNLMEYMFS